MPEAAYKADMKIGAHDVSPVSGRDFEIKFWTSDCKRCRVVDGGLSEAQ